ncbi:hypothetical protein HU200_043065 [Digitaria exilis]|uniref:Phosphosulfolactate synthase n=1 Tax=Digitaria exilis TaxID=1010633 RepID=A0A835ECG2_9POAL|nr:hypothetical protein HU200_043065 [Digitaria exilis]
MATMRGWREEVMALSLRGYGYGNEEEDRPEKPRRYGVTEMRSPFYSLRPANQALQEILDSFGPFVDGLKFTGGCHSLMGKELVREITDLAHKHDIYVSTGDWAEHLLRQGPSSFKQYVENRCLWPCFAERIEDVDLLIRRAERCLEAGADMIMIDADDVCQRADSLRTDIVAKIVGRLGLEKTMFEASNPNTSEWFVRRYGPRVWCFPRPSEQHETRPLFSILCLVQPGILMGVVLSMQVNLFVDHSDVMNLERLRGFNMVRGDTSSRFASPFFLM